MFIQPTPVRNRLGHRVSVRRDVLAGDPRSDGGAGGCHCHPVLGAVAHRGRAAIRARAVIAGHRML